MQYIVQKGRQVDTGKEKYLPGAVVDLEESQGKVLVQKGMLRPVVKKGKK